MRRKIYNEEARLNLKVVIALARCMQSIHRTVSPAIRKAGLTVSQFGVLEFAYHKGPNKIGEFTKKTLSTGGNMTVVIDNLEKLKYVRRESALDDRRAVLIHLTEVGEELISELFPSHLDNLNSVLEVLTSKEKEKLIAITGKLSHETDK